MSFSLQQEFLRRCLLFCKRSPTRLSHPRMGRHFRLTHVSHKIQATKSTHLLWYTITVDHNPSTITTQRHGTVRLLKNFLHRKLLDKVLTKNFQESMKKHPWDSIPRVDGQSPNKKFLGDIIPWVVDPKKIGVIWGREYTLIYTEKIRINERVLNHGIFRRNFSKWKNF